MNAAIAQPTETELENKTSQTSQPEFEAEVWWKTGFAVYQNTHGKLIFDQSGVTMLDQNGQSAFKFSYQDIEEARFSTSQVVFKAAGRRYQIEFYNLPKDNTQMALGSQSLLGFIWFKRGLNDIALQAPVGEKAAKVLREHSVNVSGSSTAARFKKIQIFGIFIGIAVMLAIFGIVALVMVLTGQ